MIYIDIQKVGSFIKISTWFSPEQEASDDLLANIELVPIGELKEVSYKGGDRYVYAELGKRYFYLVPLNYSVHEDEPHIRVRNIGSVSPNTALQLYETIESLL